MSVKINTLEIENVKRIKALKLEPSENGLTIIGGKNNQGKTSVLDSIAWALGGDKYKPSQAQREGSVIPPSLHITLSNGLVVERKGKNSSLKVIDPDGNKGGQTLLNEFITQLALDLPQFMQSTSKEKAQTLLQIIGVGDQLYALEQQEEAFYNKRHAIGAIADQKKKYAAELEHYGGVPSEPISATELISQQQEILARNGENQRKRAERDRYEAELIAAQDFFKQAMERLEEAKKRLAIAEENVKTARTQAEGLVDESTEELKNNIAAIEEINVKIRANLDKERAEEEAKGYSQQYEALTAQIEKVRQDKLDLLKNADLPLEGLSVENSELTYLGHKWDNMSGSQQLIVSTAIVRKLNPQCGFVLLDKLEQLDTDTMREFGRWLEEQGLQAIATRVSTGDECSIIIEDGYAKSEPKEYKEYKVGVF